MTETLLRIFYVNKYNNTICAGVVLERGKVIKTAPVLRGLMGMKTEELLELIKKQNWFLDSC